MDFKDLRKFIDDSLTVSQDAENGFEDFPNTEEEFLDLAKILQSKIRDVAFPPPPPEPKFPDFQPSPLLEKLQDESQSVYYRLQIAKVKPGHIEKRSRKLRRHIKRLESQENKKYREQRNAFFKLHYSKQAQEWETVRSSIQLREKIVSRVRKDIEKIFVTESNMDFKRLPWKVLSSQKSSATFIYRYYENLQRQNSDIIVDKERLLKALSLEPENYYVGTGEFEKYIVLTFKHTSKVLLECPEFGNAIYVIHSDWQRLSRMSKKDLMSYRQHQATKIVHRGDWFFRVKRELDIR